MRPLLALLAILLVLFEPACTFIRPANQEAQQSALSKQKKNCRTDGRKNYGELQAHHQVKLVNHQSYDLSATTTTNTESRRMFLRQSFYTLLGAYAYGSAQQAQALDIGKPAPDFDLPGATSAKEINVRLDDLKGKWVVLYFYPADFTGGCSIEAARFQKFLPEFESRNAQILGVSLDDAASHRAFCKDLKLGFPLLADSTGEVTEKYGALFKSEEYGEFSKRQTYLVDPRGVLRAQWLRVNPAAHADEVLAELRRLQPEQQQGQRP